MPGASVGYNAGSGGLQFAQTFLLGCFFRSVRSGCVRDVDRMSRSVEVCRGLPRPVEALSSVEA